MNVTDLNPLDVLGARRINFLAPHLHLVPINDFYWGNNEIIKWIETNLKSRYFYGQVSYLNDNEIKRSFVVAFEDPIETTMFLLKCPHIGQK